MTRSELIRDRLFECIHNGELEFDDQVKIFKYLSELFGLKTISNQAKAEKVSPAAIYQSKRKSIKIYC